MPQPTRAIVYPASLPTPKTAPFSPAERRAINVGRPFQSRSVQVDRLATQGIAWPPLTIAQAGLLRDWWRDDLADGGNWFLAPKWPQPQGRGGVRQFVGALEWQNVPGGYVNVSGLCTVRGAGSDPVLYISDCDLAAEGAEIAISEPLKVNLWAGGQPSSGAIAANQPILGDYYPGGHGAGDVDPGSYFPLRLSIDWEDLAEPPGVTVFGLTRNTIWPSSTTSLDLTVTNFPSRPSAILCRSCAFVNYGQALGVAGIGQGQPGASPVRVNGVEVGYPIFVPNGGAGVAFFAFLLRDERGHLTGVDVTN